MPANKTGDADGQGRAVARPRRAGRLCLAGQRRPAHLRRRQRRHPLRARRQDGRARRGNRTSARFRSRRRCWPTASSTSEPRTASSSSSGRSPIARRSSTRTGSGSEQNPEADRRRAGRRARPGLRRLDECDLRDRSEDGARGRGRRIRPAGAAKPGAASLPAGVPRAARDAHRAHPEAG